MHKALFHGTLVAAKILKTSSAIALGDFRSEIEVLRKVHHPNAVQFLGACTKQEPYILVTGAPREPSHAYRFSEHQGLCRSCFALLSAVRASGAGHESRLQSVP